MTHTQRIRRELIRALRDTARPLGDHQATRESMAANARAARDLLAALGDGGDVPDDCPLVVVQVAWLDWDAATAVRASDPDLN